MEAHSGVVPHRSKFMARVMKDGKYVHMSLHDTEEEAKEAFKEASKKHSNPGAYQDGSVH